MTLAAFLLIVAAGGAGSQAREGLRVRASEAVAPCVEAAVRSHPVFREGVRVEAGPLESAEADVLVASAVEITRALEKGEADPATDRDVAEIPWVLRVPEGNPMKLGGLADVKRLALTVWVPAGPAAYEARRTVESAAPGRLREATDAEVLRSAPVALVPLSLAPSGERVRVEVPPLVARAAASARTPRPEASRALVEFLASEAGQRAFASCGATSGAEP